MTDPTTPSSEEAAAEQQAREYAAQIRSAPAEQVVTELLGVLLNAAQAKLGRRDARLLIDLSAAMIDQVRRYVNPELSKQVDHVLSQLRLAQVQAEGAASGERGTEPNDLPENLSPPGGASDQASGAGGQPTARPRPPAQPQPNPATGLWIPGRDF